MRKFIWDERTLTHTAELLAKWNSRVLGTDANVIQEKIKKQGEESYSASDTWSISTAGYCITFHVHENGSIYVTTLLDPGVWAGILHNHLPEKTS